MWLGPTLTHCVQEFKKALPGWHCDMNILHALVYLYTIS